MLIVCGDKQLGTSKKQWTGSFKSMSRTMERHDWKTSLTSRWVSHFKLMLCSQMLFKPTNPYFKFCWRSQSFQRQPDMSGWIWENEAQNSLNTSLIVNHHEELEQVWNKKGKLLMSHKELYRTIKSIQVFSNDWWLMKEIHFSSLSSFFYSFAAWRSGMQLASLCQTLTINMMLHCGPLQKQSRSNVLYTQTQ